MSPSFADPEDLVIPGPGDPLHDRRHTRPILDRDVLATIAWGVILPVCCLRRGTSAVVLDGSLRVRWARRANEILRSRGEAPIKVPVVFRNAGDVGEAIGVSAAANSHRHNDTLLEKVARAARMQSLGGRTHTEIALAFGTSPKTIFKWLQIAAVPAEAQTALAERRIRQEDAYQLAKLPAEEQAPALEAILRDRPTRQALKAAGQNAFRTGTVHRVRTDTRLRRLEELIGEQPHHFPPDVGLLVRWARGAASDRELVNQFPCASEMVKCLSRHGMPRSPSRSPSPTGTGVSTPATIAASPTSH